jgi:hypothetical protein
MHKLFSMGMNELMRKVNKRKGKTRGMRIAKRIDDY